ncbi:MliC family protein [Flavobacterium sp. MAH-1]|uniref:MliC family protein n=1 Tax=Flavobacterium agri TaxID=2743471 RepID=A0A7Y8Y244_9FLAO|nr:MliC family protein [Flavobacterium agri]NUY81190.1 MliC family protein [Flavobacterium agri]NYA71214.1 MliC family protein [Flavobacterium agri]
MKKQFLLPMVMLMALMSCQKQNSREATEVNEEAVVNEAVTPDKATDSIAVTGLGCDNGYQMNISWPDGPQSETIKVEMVRQGNSEIVEMTHAMSADGAKYEATDGRYIWNKGHDWMYGKGDQTICGCTEK